VCRLSRFETIPAILNGVLRRLSRKHRNCDDEEEPAMGTTVRAESVVREILAGNIAVAEAMKKDDELIQGIVAAGSMIREALQDNHRLLLIGNGGSAAEAQRLAMEFVCRYRSERQALPAFALNCNTSMLSAIASEYGFEDVFTRQVEAFAQPGDVLWCISTDGDSREVVRAALLGEALRAKTIGLTGADGGALRKCVDLCLCAPAHETQRIQEAHTLISHAIAELVEAGLCVDCAI
jgi:D-sedoheptulose 7-phosphate isomerase